MNDPQEAALQQMINAIIEMQADWPMPKEGWAAFKADIEHTNQKYGYDLRIEL